MTKMGKLAFPIKWSAMQKKIFCTPLNQLIKEDRTMAKIILEYTFDNQPLDIIDIIN